MMDLIVCFQSMHWAVRNKKEPMLECPKAEVPGASETGERHDEQDASGISAEDTPSASREPHLRFLHCDWLS